MSKFPSIAIIFLCFTFIIFLRISYIIIVIAQSSLSPLLLQLPSRLSHFLSNSYLFIFIIITHTYAYKDTTCWDHLDTIFSAIETLTNTGARHGKANLLVVSQGNLKDSPDNRGHCHCLWLPSLTWSEILLLKTLYFRNRTWVN